MNYLKLAQDTQDKDIIDYFSIQQKVLSIQIEDTNPQLQFEISTLSDYIIHQKHVEQLKLVIDSKCKIDLIEFEQIFHALKQLQLLNTLQIDIRELCYVQLEGINLISELISSIKHLQKLDITILKNNYIKSQGLIALSNSFQDKPNLTSLSIQIDNDTSISSLGISDFFAGLKILKNLQDLSINLQSNHFDENSSISLGSTIKHLQKLKCLSIQLRDINAQKIETIFAESIGSLTEIQKLSMKILSPLQVRQEIIQQFINSFKLLSTLVEIKVEGLISDQDQLNSLEFANIFKYTTNLKSLNLNITQSSIFSDQLLITYSQSIESLNNIQSIELILHPYTLNSEQGFINLFSTIKKMKNITSFYLNVKDENKLYTQGARIMGETLSEFKLLKSLKLFFKQNTFQKNQIVQFALFLKQLTSLEYLDLELNCGIGVQECVEIAKSIRYLVNLRELFFDFTSIEDSYLGMIFDYGYFMDVDLIRKELIESIKQLKYLKLINLNKNLKLNDNIDLINLATSEDQKFEFDVAYLYKEEFLQNLNDQFLDSLQKVRILQLLFNYFNDKNIQSNICSIFSKITNLKELTINIEFSKLNHNFQIQFASSLVLDNLEKLVLVIQNGNNKLEELISEIFKKLKNLKELKIKLILSNQYYGGEQPYKLLENIPILFNLIKLDLYISDQSLYFQFDSQKIIGNLKYLQHLHLDIQKNMNDQEIENLQLALISLKNLKQLKLNFKGDTINEMITKLQNLEYLQYYQTESRTSFKQYISQFSEISQYQWYYPTQLTIKQALFDKKSFDYNFKFKNLIVLDVFLYKQEDYVIEQFEQFVDQIKQLKYLQQLVFYFLDKDGQSRWVDILDQKKNEGMNYQLKQVEEGSSNQDRYLETLNITIENFWFNHFHAFIIGRMMKSLNNLQKFKLDLCFKNNIGDIGLENIFQQFQYLSQLTELDICLKKQTYFGEKSAITLGNSLKQLKLLQNLRIIIGKQERGLQNGILLIAEGIKKLQNLISLVLEVDYQLQADTKGDCDILIAIGEVKSIRNLQILVSPNYQIKEQPKSDIFKNYNQFLNEDYQFYDFDQQILATQNSQIISLLQNLNQINGYSLNMLINDQQHDFFQQLVQHIKSSKQTFVMKLILIDTNYFSQSYLQTFDQNLSLITKMIALLQDLTPHYHQILDIKIGFKNLNNLIDSNLKNSIIICKKNNNQINIIFSIQLLIEEITQINQLLQSISQVIQSFNKLQCMNLSFVIDRALNEKQSNDLFNIITKSQSLLHLNLQLEIDQTLESYFYACLEKNIQSLKFLQWLTFQEQNSIENKLNLKNKLLRKCQRLSFIDYKEAGLQMEEVD